MSLGITVNVHVHESVTKVDTHAPTSPTATVKVTQHADGYSGVTLFFADLAHAERWVRDLLGQVEVAKCEAANDQPKPEPRTVMCREVQADRAFICTLPKGHYGEHVAHGDEGDVCATWPQAEVAASDPVPVQPAGEVVGVPGRRRRRIRYDIERAEADYRRYEAEGGVADLSTWWTRYADDYRIEVTA